MSNWTTDHVANIAVITFDRPPRNFMSFAALGELSSILESLRNRDDVSVILLTSSVPGYFVAHADLDDLSRVARGEPVEGERTAWRTTPSLIEAMPQPVIAAINGQAWGGGTELALACTLRVATPDASFGLPEIAVGMVPGAGGTQRLPRLIGQGRALELILSGRKVGAEEAVEIGLINAILPEDGFLDHALDWARRISVHYGPALAANKRAVVDGQRLAFERGLDLERELVIPRTADPASLALRDKLSRRYAEARDTDVIEF
ncbi:enoyl-CoA hydratase/isomerase family protein [Hyphomonas chukchiensis]|uniref:Enoyl-CoA hydratase n=1 Tax=Hyphomonas chukchiensis TaxID=1280947 RepID=A0A062UHY4_9PROT|nr:enoyl-CoA hydratase/isomerase family protein [Hyphomonas chukchiensis]KCZ58398.1 hypothetical protein HY30_16140 [Hyphomonas chukchiensis]|tara:strand:- start:42269 stop:43057 length:789 start_codon:yes stop_codon:yes gene_type:complete